MPEHKPGIQIPPHFWRHCISGMVILSINVIIDCVIVEKFRRPTVSFPGIGLKVMHFQTYPSVGDNIIYGFGENGQVYWTFNTNK